MALPHGALHAAVPAGHSPGWARRVPLQHRLHNAEHIVDILETRKEKQDLVSIASRQRGHNPSCLNRVVRCSCGGRHVFEPPVNGRGSSAGTATVFRYEQSRGRVMRITANWNTR